jgi:hypothetical protein
MITEETWKDIPNYEGIYQASSYGRIKSCARVIHYKKGKIIHRKERFLSLIKGFGQYLTVGLFKNNHHITYNVHYLIAITFIENPNSLPCVNHKDENKYNNKVDNLEWCTYSYNTKYNNGMRKRIDTRNLKNTHGREKKVYQYDSKGNLIKIWDSVSSVEKELGFKKTNISSCCLNKKSQAYGYKWLYYPL